MSEAIRVKDEHGQTTAWETQNGQVSFSFDEERREVVMESPSGTPELHGDSVDYDAFMAGLGHQAVRTTFDDIVLAEILEAVGGQAAHKIRRRAPARRLRRR